jgi:hypothetical protein
MAAPPSAGDPIKVPRTPKIAAIKIGLYAGSFDSELSGSTTCCNNVSMVFQPSFQDDASSYPSIHTLQLL